MHEIFISYRRKDSSVITGRIFDHLMNKYGKDALFKDVDSIPLGVDFRTVIDLAVGECKVLLAIIGDDWLEATDASGARRIDQEADFVRAEIEAALKRNIPVIPVLVEDQLMPKAEDLPAPLRQLAFRNATKVRPDPDFHNDMNRLFDQLTDFVPTRKVFGRIVRRVFLLIIALGILFSMTYFRDAPHKLTPEEIKLYQRHLAMARAFEESQAWQSALESYEKAEVFRPDNKELRKAIDRMKKKIGQ